MSIQNSKNIRQRDGIATSTGSAQQFDTVKADLVMFKVIVGNTVFIGDASPIFPVEAGDDTGWIGCKNLDDFYHSTGAGGSSGTIYWIAQWD
jgi:hypothetical protein